MFLSSIITIFQAAFERQFPDKLLPQYFQPCEIGFAAPKSLGVVTPLVHNCDPSNGQAAYAPLKLHSNWTVVPGLEFKIGELTLKEYVHFLGMYIKNFRLDLAGLWCRG